MTVTFVVGQKYRFRMVECAGEAGTTSIAGLNGAVVTLVSLPHKKHLCAKVKCSKGHTWRVFLDELEPVENIHDSQGV